MKKFYSMESILCAQLVDSAQGERIGFVTTKLTYADSSKLMEIHKETTWVFYAKSSKVNMKNTTDGNKSNKWHQFLLTSMDEISWNEEKKIRTHSIRLLSIGIRRTQISVRHGRSFGKQDTVERGSFRNFLLGIAKGSKIASLIQSALWPVSVLSDQMARKRLISVGPWRISTLGLNHPWCKLTCWSIWTGLTPAGWLEYLQATSD